MPRPHRVAVLALPGVVPFELAIPARIFGGALDPATLEPCYEVMTCSLDGGPVRTDADFEISVAHGPELLETADSVVVPPSHCSDFLDQDGAPGCLGGTGGVAGTGQDGEVLAQIAAALGRVRPGTRMIAICTGAFVLAAVGLLRGRPAATHWAEAARLQAQHPDVRVNADVLYIDDGDVLTSAGVAAGIDLCLHVIRRDHGSAVANLAARLCVVPPRREGGQAQYVTRHVPAPGIGGTAEARAWVLERLGQPVSLAALAAQSKMSVRTITRRFREETGLSPGAWLATQRLDYARQLLEDSDLNVDQVAERAGLGSGANLRAQLRSAAGVSPSAYRKAFRSTGVAR